MWGKIKMQNNKRNRARMKNPAQKKKRQTSVFILTAITAVLIFTSAVVLNYLTPLFADDFSYSVSFETKLPISSFYDIYRSQLVHYKSTNGRSVVHALAQLLLWVGKPVLNYINGAAFLSFCLLIYFHAFGTLRSLNYKRLIFLYSVLFFLTPTFGGSYLWVMGAANYLYSPQIILIYLIPYRLALSRRVALYESSESISYDSISSQGEKKHSSRGADILRAIIFLPCGVVAGWTNENTSIAMTFMVIAFIFAMIICSGKGERHPSRRVPLWMFTGLLGNIAGALLLFLSPAQKKRLEGAGGIGGVGTMVRRALSITKNAVLYLWPLLLILIVLLAVIIIKLRGADSTKRRRARITFITPVIYTLGSLLCLYSMAGSPEFPRWVWGPILGFILIALSSIYETTIRVFYSDKSTSVDSPLKKQRISQICKWATVAISALLFISCIFGFKKAVGDLLPVKNAYDARVEYIEDMLSQGYTDVTVDIIKSDSPYSSYNLFDELSFNSSSWPNTAVARYFGLTSISRRN